MTAPRPLVNRIAEAQRRLAETDQLWLATGGSQGAHLIPVAFVYDGEDIVTATAEHSKTVANLREAKRARLALGATDDVVMIDADLVEFVAPSNMQSPIAERYAAISHDPRNIPGYIYLRLRPQRAQVWNGFHEFTGRTVMQDGRWLA